MSHKTELLLRQIEDFDNRIRVYTKEAEEVFQKDQPGGGSEFKKWQKKTLPLIAERKVLQRQLERMKIMVGEA